MDEPIMMTDEELDTLYATVRAGIERLYDQSEIGDGVRARILVYCLARYLD
jgi:hypothetical protein